MQIFMKIDTAHEELANCPGMLEKLDKVISKAPVSHQNRWCENSECGCMGCINREVQSIGLTKAHWLAWKNNFKNTLTYNIDNKTNVILKDVGNNPDAVIDMLKHITRLSHCEVFKLLNKDMKLQQNINFTQAEACKKLLELAGAKIELRKTVPNKCFNNTHY